MNTLVGLLSKEQLSLEAARPRGYKTFINSVEHEILNAHKYKNIKKFSQIFSSSDNPRMLFFLLINVKIPTLVGILTLMSRKNVMLR